MTKLTVEMLDQITDKLDAYQLFVFDEQCSPDLLASIIAAARKGLEWEYGQTMTADEMMGAGKYDPEPYPSEASAKPLAAVTPEEWDRTPIETPLTDDEILQFWRDLKKRDETIEHLRARVAKLIDSYGQDDIIPSSEEQKEPR